LLLERPALLRLFALMTAGAFAMQIAMRHLAPASPTVLPGWALCNFLALPLAVIAWVDGDGRRGPRAVAALAAGAALFLVVPLAYSKEVDAYARENGAPFLLFGVVAAAAALWSCRLARVDLRAWGLGKGEPRWWLPRVGAVVVVILVSMPLAALVFPELATFYPRYKPARAGSEYALLTYNLGMGGYMLCWEFFCRGFLLHGVQRYCGATAAILLQAFPFFLLHAHKPEPEMASAYFGGLLMGWLSLRAGTMLPGVLIHWALYSWMEIVGFYL
jgi:membrane protease YdiL (CAAX protease family)